MSSGDAGPSSGGTGAAKRPADTLDAQDLAKKAKADWMGKPVNAASAPALPQLQKKEEVKKAVSSIAAKLSAPKLSKGGAVQDPRKTKVGSFSAGLTKEKILEAQARHREHAEATGKPVPHYRSNH